MQSITYRGILACQLQVQLTTNIFANVNAFVQVIL